MDPLRVRVEDLEGTGTEAYAFIRSPVRVGRGDLNDLRIDRPYISSWHGVIQFDDEGIRFIDLGSTNGTFVDGARLDRNRPATILPSTELLIGKLRIVLSRGAAEGQTVQPEPITCFARQVAHDSSTDQPQVPSAPVNPFAELPASAPSIPAPPADEIAAAFAAAAPADYARDFAPDLSAPPAAEPEPAVESVLEAASWQLGVLHDACKQASESFQTALDGILGSLTDGQRKSALAAIGVRYPFAHVPGAAPAPLVAAPYRAPAAIAAPPPPVQALHSYAPGISLANIPAAALAPATGLGGDALRLVRAFAEAYLSAASVPATAAALEALLGSVAEALETAARGYLELKSGYEQFGREMGIRIPKGEGALARATDARQLVGWLLAPAEGESRTRQLAGAFADLMIHQVALLNGVQAGARSMLDELSPELLAAAAERDGRGGLGLRTLKEAGFWRMFVERWHALADEESAVTDALFGKSFAKAYSAVAGRRSMPDPDSDPALTPRTPKRK